MLKYIASRFLLAFLSIKTILQEATIHRRRQKLSAMKNGRNLGGAYKATLRRIRAQDEEKARLGMAVLMWATHSRRPLQVDEICHAIAIRIGSNDLNSDDIPAISTLLDCCQGLVTVEEGTSTVRLIHFTLQEYLCTHPDLFGRQNRTHSTMAETCLTYLNFQHVNNLSTSTSPNMRGTPFLEYSSLYWGTHMRMELSNLAKTLALEFLDQFDSHISAKSLWRSISRGLIVEYTPSHKWFSALHCISYFGIADVAYPLIKMNRWDVNQQDRACMTPLIWAARCGHVEVVRLLLRETHIQPDQQDTNYGRTALSWAAGNGHEGVVSLFLGRPFVNLRSIGRRWGKAPRVAALLFGRRYVNPDSSSKSGRTPLSWAAENGHEGIVKLLLRRKDINPDTADTVYGRMPLLWAAKNGHEGIVRLLLERKDVNPDIPDTKLVRTPLSWAARNGHKGIVKLLLGRKDVNPDSSNISGRTPLSWAARHGHEGIVSLLLRGGKVNPDSSDKYCRTPLSWAAENGCEGVVKLLLRHQDVNPDIPDIKYGQTPLSWAAENGHEGVVKLLLRRRGVNPDTPDTKHGQTPLSWAAENGHEEVVKLLLGRRDVNPDSSDKCRRTPLSWAAENGHEGVVNLLLEREEVNPDSLDKYCRTPLSWAAENGHEGIVKLLLEWQFDNPHSSSKFGQTPTTLAAKNGHHRVVQLLQARRSRPIRELGPRVFL